MRFDSRVIVQPGGKFATFSGISGVPPKILVRDESASAVLKETRPRLFV